MSAVEEHIIVSLRSRVLYDRYYLFGILIDNVILCFVSILCSLYRFSSQLDQRRQNDVYRSVSRWSTIVIITLFRDNVKMACLGNYLREISRTGTLAARKGYWEINKADLLTKYNIKSPETITWYPDG